MNFDDAITAHSQWKIRLQSVINGTSKEVLDPAVVCLDNKCPLGQWIYGDAKAYAALPDYEHLRVEHANFHQCAAEVLKFHLAGDLAKAKGSLDPGGPFHEASVKTIIAIRHLRKQVEK